MNKITKKTNRKPAQQEHFCLLVNKQATNYDERAVKRFTSAIRSKGHSYTVVEPGSAVDLLHAAESAAGLRRAKTLYTPQVSKRGKVTALIACGGDGTFNLVARAALRGNLPVGVLPMGRFNDIANSLYHGSEIGHAIKRILLGKTSEMKGAKIGNQYIFGSVSLGFPVELYRLLTTEKRPRFGLGWASMASKALDSVSPMELTVKIDAFKFELLTSMVTVCLRSFLCGLPINNMSFWPDKKAEVIIDFSSSAKELTGYIKKLSKGHYDYGTQLRQFRGENITLQPVEGQILLLDGEIVELPLNIVQIEVDEKTLTVYE